MKSKSGGFLALVALLINFITIVEPQSAFAATTYSFTNAGATGRLGPTQSQITTAYTATSLAGSVTINTQGIQEWIVPTSGKYQIVAIGAAGGTGNTGEAGKGASQTVEITLTSGTLLRIIVGQRGLSGTYVAGGGGASWVTTTLTTTTPIVISGGGGGGGYSGSNNIGINAVLTNNGTNGNGVLGGAGVNGNGATAYSNPYAAGGAGWLSDGNVSSVSCDSYGTAARAPRNDATGGIPNGLANGGAGGFGGGGASGVMCGAIGAGGGGGYSGGGAGTTVGSSYSGGGGGGSYVSPSATLTASAVTNTGAGSVTITSLGPAMTNFVPRTTITNSSSITYDLSFSENVTGLAVGDFSLAGTGSSTCSIGTPTGSGTTYTVALSGCSPGTVILTIAANAVANTSSQTAPASNTAATTVTIDQTAPTISTVTAPANKTYLPSETPTFTVAFSESVTVTGTPRLTLTVGSTTEYANFVSMSDSKTALFRYTVASDPVEFDTDGITLATSLDLNSGTIRDLATNTLTNLSLTAPTLTSVLVAQPPAAPTIDSITATSGTLTVYFTPGATRGSAITNYTYATNGTTFKARTDGTTASPLVITTVSTGATNLVNGTGYQVRIRAVSAAGTSDSSTVVNETPTAVAVTGDSTLTLTYGNSASTSAYSATGGTGTYTWSLGSTLTGITISGTTVTAGATTPAGIYSQTVRATDGNSQVGSKTLTITVNKASTSITIALPNSATSAALGGAVTITATVPRAGAVNFKLGGTTISGCGSASAASTTATCSWTPNALGSVSLTATFTPTDSSNYETSTTTTLSITVVNGVSNVTLSLAGGTTTSSKGQTINIIAAVDQAGRITFLIDGKRIPGCTNKSASVGNVTCSWKPAVQKTVTITANLNPTNSVYNNSTGSLRVEVVRRTGRR